MAISSSAATLDGPRQPPALGGRPRQLIVLLHGYGADGADLIALAEHWRSLLPDAAFAAPNAPERVPGSPSGYQWFPLGNYDPNDLRDPAPRPASGREAEARLEGLARAKVLLDRFLDAELARLGLAPERLALVGFSQGTMLTLETGLRRLPACAALVGFSGALLGPERLETETLAKPRVMLLHGDADPVVPAEALFNAASGLALAGIGVEWHLRPGLGHGIDPHGLALAGQFLRQAFL